MWFTIKKNKRNKYYFNIISANGKVFTTSEDYSSYRACRRAVNAMCKKGINADTKVVTQ